MRIPLTILLSLIPLATVVQDTALRAHRKPLAIVKILPAKSSFKLGEPIEVTLLLEAGNEGVYVAKTWGQAGGAVPGFFYRLKL